jgi:hypothetical protein
MGVGRYEKWAPYTVNSQTLTANDHFVNFVSPGSVGTNRREVGGWSPPRERPDQPLRP